MTAYELNRKKYKDVKRMDHGQMSSFCRELYMKGYEEGEKEAMRLSDDEIAWAIFQVKGIGEKKVNDILCSLSKAREMKKGGTL